MACTSQAVWGPGRVIPNTGAMVGGSRPPPETAGPPRNPYPGLWPLRVQARSVRVAENAPGRGLDRSSDTRVYQARGRTGVTPLPRAQSSVGLAAGRLVLSEVAGVRAPYGAREGETHPAGVMRTGGGTGRHQPSLRGQCTAAASLPLLSRAVEDDLTEPHARRTPWRRMGPLRTNAEIVGERIRVAREKKGWTQKVLADQIARSQTAISYWENGRRMMNVDELLVLASALGVPAAGLLPLEK